MSNRSGNSTLPSARSGARGKFLKPVDYWVENKDGALTLHFTLRSSAGEAEAAGTRSL